MALALAEAGATVALLAREEAKAAEVVNRIRANGGGQRPRSVVSTRADPRQYRRGGDEPA